MSLLLNSHLTKIPSVGLEIVKKNFHFYTNLCFKNIFRNNLKMTERFDVVVVGSIFMDFLCYADRLPIPGETIEGSDFKTGFGGKGANQCVAAARLGSKTAFVGKIGKDSNGEQYYEHFKKEGVNVACIEIDETVPTGATSIMVGTNNGENVIIIVPGATGKLNEASVNRQISSNAIQSAKVVVTQLEVPTEAALAALRLAKLGGTITIWNIAPAQHGLPLEMFELSDILCLNETEAEIVTGVSNVQDTVQAKLAIEQLVSNFHSKDVILTLGSEGALLWEGASKNLVSIKAPKLSKVVDTTGAGDCFIGTLAHYIANGDSISEATQKAVQNASQSVLVKGTQTSYPYKIVNTV